MLIRNSISWFAFGKRAVICFKQRLSRHYAGCQTQFGVFMQQNHGPKKFPLLLDKTRLINHRYGTIKQFSLLSTTELIQTLSARNIVQFWKNTGCHRQHNCLQLRSFSTSEKEKVTSTSSELTNEHWGPYLVSRIHSLEELSRFHGYSTLRWGLSIIVAALAGVYFFRDQLRDNVADEFADVASRSMADENVILKAHDMTKGVLKRLTSEADTSALASEFLKTVLQQNDVRNTAVSFATSIFDHPETQEKLQEVVKNTLHSILNNKETKDLLLEFIKNLIEDPQTKETCNIFLQSLTKDPDIQKMVSEFFKSVLASPTFQIEAITLGREVTNKVVHDKDIQKQTGDALWSAVKYGVTPHWFREEK